MTASPGVDMTDSTAEVVSDRGPGAKPQTGLPLDPGISATAAMSQAPLSLVPDPLENRVVVGELLCLCGRDSTQEQQQYGSLKSDITVHQISHTPSLRA